MKAEKLSSPMKTSILQLTTHLERLATFQVLGRHVRRATVAEQL